MLVYVVIEKLPNDCKAIAAFDDEYKAKQCTTQGNYRDYFTLQMNEGRDDRA